MFVEAYLNAVHAVTHIQAFSSPFRRIRRWLKLAEIQVFLGAARERTRPPEKRKEDLQKRTPAEDSSEAAS
jgi:hypothetical protein